MSYCRKEGKDEIIFATKEDLESPSKAIINVQDEEEEPGLILPSGEINWNCPCLGGMASGPCGVDFREAFSCFHFSKAEPKGSDCFEQFKTMQECMLDHPDLYPTKDVEDKDVAEMGPNLEDLDENSGEQNTPVVSEKNDVDVASKGES
ncbi:hypothetical protein ScPMuIL_008761 [Solemya velum]